MLMEEYRIYIFFFGLIFFSALEFFISYRKRELKRSSRWPHNILIIFAGSLIARVLFPSGLAVICLWAQGSGFGFFNLFEFPFVVEIILSILILDMAIYWQHWAFHKNKFLWKLHRVHHSDVDLDTTSALRFHPFEIIISLGYKAILIILFGFSAESIFLFEIILNFMAMFNHSNLSIPSKIEKYLRYFIVTPQMHIIHHSIERFESDTNYGFNFTFWDRAFKSYSDVFKSRGIIGNKKFRLSKDHSILQIMTQPFK